jgi:hypothetical protein
VNFKTNTSQNIELFKVNFGRLFENNRAQIIWAMFSIKNAP